MKILLKAQASFYLFSLTLSLLCKPVLDHQLNGVSMWSRKQPGKKAVQDRGDWGSWWTSSGLGARGQLQALRTGCGEEAAVPAWQQ